MKASLIRIARAAASTMLIAGLVPVGLAVSAVSASAASCSGYSCHGLDPSGRCTDTKDLPSIARINDPLDPEEVAVLNNKFSAGCNSNWAVATLTSGAYYAGDSLVVFISTTDSRGNPEYMCFPGPNSTGALDEYCDAGTYRGLANAYTDMVDGTNVTYAYVDVYDPAGNLIASAGAAL